MAARLFCKTGELVGNQFDIEREATIGKDPTNTIVLAPGIISAQHARIFYDENAQAYFLEDTKSRNGTKLDGTTVSTREKLGKLHVITFANTYDFIFVVPDTAARVSRQAPVAEQPRPAVSPTAAAQDVPAIPPALGADRAPSGTVAESDIPLLAPDLRLGSPVSPGTMAESDIPLLAPDLRPGSPVSPGTMAESDIPLLAPDLRPRSPVSPGTMAESDIPLLAPDLKPGSPVSPGTMAESDIPLLPKFTPQQQQPQQPPEPQGPGTIMAPSDLPLLPNLQQSGQKSPQASTTVSYLLEEVKDNKRFPLGSGENVIGRSGEATIRINHTTVSRRHAIITVSGSRLMLKDLGSANHTFVDNQQIHSEVEVTEKNKIRLGSVEVRIVKEK